MRPTSELLSYHNCMQSTLSLTTLQTEGEEYDGNHYTNLQRWKSDLNTFLLLVTLSVKKKKIDEEQREKIAYEINKEA